MHSASSQNTETAAIYKEIYIVSTAWDWAMEKLSVLLWKTLFCCESFGMG